MQDLQKRHLIFFIMKGSDKIRRSKKEKNEIDWRNFKCKIPLFYLSSEHKSYGGVDFSPHSVISFLVKQK